MKQKEQIMKEFCNEVQWVKYRIKMLEIIQQKLGLMINIAKYARDNDLSKEEVNIVNKKLKNLLVQVNALGEESKDVDVLN